MSSSLQFHLQPIVSDVDLAVIDFSKFQQDLDDEELTHLRDHSMLDKLREAYIKWGFFHLVNHGISVELLEKVEKVSRGLLSMPTKAKDRATTRNPLDSYRRKPNFETGTNVIISLKIWPEFVYNWLLVLVVAEFNFLFCYIC
ncbi:hypothetical protein SUGI_0852340 [Cryptomeria japonica]|nr:hypothetical protein SUGI_0852340 [Cryptomeria japonica]